MTQAKTFKALLVEEQQDHTFTKSVVERNISELPENDLLIQVHYSSLNYKDAMSAISALVSIFRIRQALTLLA